MVQSQYFYIASQLLSTAAPYLNNTRCPSLFRVYCMRLMLLIATGFFGIHVVNIINQFIVVFCQVILVCTHQSVFISLEYKLSDIGYCQTII
jgi:hypothetical protein